MLIAFWCSECIANRKCANQSPSNYGGNFNVGKWCVGPTNPVMKFPVFSFLQAFAIINLKPTEMVFSAHTHIFELRTLLTDLGIGL